MAVMRPRLAGRVPPTGARTGPLPQTARTGGPPSLMERSHRFTLLVWSAREALRRPADALLPGLALFCLVACVGAVLLLARSLEATAERVLERGPSLVVRRFSPEGWKPLPAEEALALARAVPGVRRAWTRAWGLVSGPDGPLTVVGVSPDLDPSGPGSLPFPLPSAGEAVAGPGVSRPAGHAPLVLEGAVPIAFRLREGPLPPRTGLWLHDAVLVDRRDAERLLGLPRGHASDLVVEVFHPGEEEALAPDLAAVFPWPVRITTRSEALGILKGVLAGKSGIVSVLYLPAILALVLLCAGAARDRAGTRREIGLRKAMGWTSGDLVRVHLYRALVVGVPFTVLGFAAAYAAVFVPGVRWPGSLFFGWPGNGPALTLDPTGALAVLLSTGALVLLPWLAASVWPAMSRSAADPLDLIRGEDAG